MAGALVAVALLAGCQGPLSILEPAGPAARDTARLWWTMAAYATGAWLVVVALWVVALVARRSRPSVPARRADGTGMRWIALGGVLWPLVSITLLLALGIPAGHRMQPLLVEGGPPPLRVDVLARQWAWEVRYPGSDRVLHNELRLPAGLPVDVHVRTQDVIHSFWVPRLGGKIDAIPGRVNVLRLQADGPGRHRGQCAEFCGLRHAHMSMTVLVLPPEEFTRWMGGTSP